MENRVALISIIVENAQAVEEVNRALHEAREEIIGHMGLPYRERKISIISVAVDAKEADIQSLTEKLSAISGIRVQTMLSGI
ncbi:MAG: iron-only hydrogenase system regulator [Clostridia bacterium]|nr:iron-only hydrogenase system regulator [Clostridia bacterium]MBR1686612.1 iron-only hydrogenase system regulator [Clostridia bacterium]